ncbi:MAG TPA: methyltransferase domain-containing protein [Streptosporangiaceae bacterium]|jgi:ubiquinone/menaquinone biosynthesis C-methylase UbiE|nr:methyltransferase domain-containing protein [Streptosporangiaceae bacterium]
MTANAEQIALWNGPGGERRARQPRLVDTQVRLHHERLVAAGAVGPGEQVLDVGCGTGQTTRDAARAAAVRGEGEAGEVLGVDLSAPMLEVAARLSAEEGLTNIGFERADAQVHSFPVDRFDVVISRFGVMFFDDPVAAFANIGRALRPDGRLALLVWQAREHNEWARVFRQALSGRAELPALEATGHPFTLADPAVARQILGAAGFADIGLAGVHQPVFYGDDVDTAFDLVRSLPTSMEQLAEMDEAGKAEALDRLRTALAAHSGSQGVTFAARSWVVTARRR